LSGAHLLEPGDEAQQRRLAASRGPEQHDEARALGAKAHVLDRRYAAIALRHVLENDLRHASAPGRIMPCKISALTESDRACGTRDKAQHISFLRGETHVQFHDTAPFAASSPSFKKIGTS